MSSASRHVKLGVLALAALAALVLAGLGLGLHGLGAATVPYRTYFDESVQGLDVGAPVKYRGVRIGNVSQIAIAPDRKHVAVGLAVLADEAERLGLAEANPALRTQLSSQGLTGVKFVEIDFTDPAANPPPALPFPPGAHYVPARTSTIKSLEESLQSVGDRLPDLVDRAVSTLTKLEAMLDELRGAGVPRRLADAVAGIDAAASGVRQLTQHLDRARLGDRAASTLGRLDGAIGRLDAALGQVGGEHGLIASVRRAADSLGNLGAGATGSTAELERVLHEIGDAALAFRELVEDIDRDPDMLVKGRARSGR
ncbi:MAG TPA: MlaD family protein [Kofleriaceae bacterium]|nr:MlaD family protein [Kofleriaceae bacterium]